MGACSDCGGPRNRRAERCRSCAASARRRTPKPFRCRSCGDTDESTGSRAAYCSSCRKASVATKDLCDCGRLKAKKSRTCQGCVNQAERNPMWRGGRQISDGYIRLRIVTSDGKTIYRAEHVLVMESLLGRPLFPGETVHHRNGVRGDNRPENLELWVSSQPAGQRPSDLVSWAKEVLRRYESLVGETDPEEGNVPWAI